MLKTALRYLAYITVLIAVAVCGVVLFFGGWFGWEIYKIYDQHTQFSAMPNPVVVKDGVYWFPLGGRLFAVPEKYVTRYGRNSTDGSLHAFSLHALLPDFEGRTPENKAKFNVVGRGDRIKIMVNTSKPYTQDEIYFRHKQINGIELISEYPHIEKSVDFNDNFFLIEDGHVKKRISCSNDTGDVYNFCQNMSLHYRDNIHAWIIYSRAHEHDWIKIHDQVIAFLESFERPLDAFPTHP